MTEAIAGLQSRAAAEALGSSGTTDDGGRSGEGSAAAGWWEAAHALGVAGALIDALRDRVAGCDDGLRFLVVEHVIDYMAARELVFQGGEDDPLALGLAQVCAHDLLSALIADCRELSADAAPDALAIAERLLGADPGGAGALDRAAHTLLDAGAGGRALETLA